VVPIVLYNGADGGRRRRTWPCLWPERQADYGLPTAAAVCANRRWALHGECVGPLAKPSGGLFRLENSRTPEDVQRVLLCWWCGYAIPHRTACGGPSQPGCGGCCCHALPTVSIPEVQDLGEMQSMLAERVIEWTEEWKAEGLRQGRQEGVQRAAGRVAAGVAAGLQQGCSRVAAGLAAERALLLRQTQRRLGRHVLRPWRRYWKDGTTPSSWRKVGEWIIT